MANKSTTKPTNKSKPSKTSSIWPDMSPSSDARLSRSLKNNKNLPFIISLIAIFLPVLVNIMTTPLSDWIDNPFDVYLLLPVFALVMPLQSWLFLLLFLALVVIAIVKSKRHKGLILSIALLIASIAYSISVVGFSRILF